MYCYLNRWYAAIFYTIAASLVLFLNSCAHAIPFQLDIGLSSSGEVNSYEHTVVIQGKPCVGACIIQHVRNVNLNLVTIPRQYSYTLELQCSNNINFKQDIQANKQFSLSFSPARFEGVSEFNCIGIVSPHNRPEPTTSKFRLIVLLIDPTSPQGLPFSRREDIYLDGDKIILGRYALYTNAITDTGKHIKLTKQTTMPVPKGIKSICIETESHKQRFNFKCIP
jgi:hypothetical protein